VPTVGDRGVYEWTAEGAIVPEQGLSTASMDGIERERLIQDARKNTHAR
jgi:hypothetical protein